MTGQSTRPQSDIEAPIADVRQGLAWRDAQATQPGDTTGGS